MFARIEVGAAPRPAGGRPAVNLVLLVDTSGSMEGKAIADARTASLALLDTMSPEGSPRGRHVRLEGRGAASVDAARRRGSPRGTDEDRRDEGARHDRHGGGLRRALDQAEFAVEKDGVNRIVLLGDGVPNDDAQINGLVAGGDDARHLDHHDGSRRRLRRDVDGPHRGAVRRQVQLRRGLREGDVLLQRGGDALHRVVAKSAWLELRPGPGVRIKSVIGRRAA